VRWIPTVLVLEERFCAASLDTKDLRKERLGSRTYTKIMRWNSRVGATRWIERLAGLHSDR